MKTRIQLEQLMQQVEDMQSEQEILEREVNRDELTGAYNRRFLETLIREHTDGAAEESFAFIVMDVDCFKEYNDFYGHLKGDEALREIAACMMEGAGSGYMRPVTAGTNLYVSVSALRKKRSVPISKR